MAYKHTCNLRQPQVTSWLLTSSQNPAGAVLTPDSAADSGAHAGTLQARCVIPSQTGIVRMIERQQRCTSARKPSTWAMTAASCFGRGLAAEKHSLSSLARSAGPAAATACCPIRSATVLASIRPSSCIARWQLHAAIWWLVRAMR